MNNINTSIHVNAHLNGHLNAQKKESEDKMIKYHSPLSTLLEEKYDHGSKIMRTNHQQHPNHPVMKNGYYRHTSNESTRLEAKLTTINSNTNINAIKYVKTAYVGPNIRQDLDHNSPLITKPNSVNVVSKTNDHFPTSTAYVEKYIKDANHANTPVVVPTATSNPNQAITNRHTHNQYVALNQTPYSAYRSMQTQHQVQTRQNGKQEGLPKQISKDK